jgi:glucose-6-phosphate isomerase
VGDKLSVNGVNVMPEVHKVLNQITDLVGRIHDGLWRGYTEKPITDVVNIGIGGSFLGPSWSPKRCCPTRRKACAATTWRTSTAVSSTS